jgi:hypothetical protein
MTNEFIETLKQLIADAETGKKIDESQVLTAAQRHNNSIDTKPVTCLVCGSASSGPYAKGTHGLIFATQVTHPNGEINSGAEGNWLLHICPDCWKGLHFYSLVFIPRQVLREEDFDEDDSDFKGDDADTKVP